MDEHEFLYRLSAKVYLYHHHDRLMYVDNPEQRNIRVRVLAWPDVIA